MGPCLDPLHGRLHDRWDCAGYLGRRAIKALKGDFSGFDGGGASISKESFLARPNSFRSLVVTISTGSPLSMTGKPPILCSTSRRATSRANNSGGTVIGFGFIAALTLVDSK